MRGANLDALHCGRSSIMRIARLVLGLTSLSFAGLGAAAIIAPIPMAGIVEIVLPTATAQIDYIATYGGFELGFALFLLFCQWRAEWVRQGLIASGLALAGFALARAGGLIFVPGPVQAILFPVLVLEIAGCLLSFWAARRALPPAPPEEPHAIE